MADSTLINLEDVRAITRIIGECRELGDDPIVWRQHFLASLGQLVGAELILTGEIGGVLSGQVCMPGGTAWGFEHGFNIEGYQALGQLFAEGPLKSETVRCPDQSYPSELGSRERSHAGTGSLGSRVGPLVRLSPDLC